MNRLIVFHSPGCYIFVYNLDRAFRSDSARHRARTVWQAHPAGVAAAGSFAAPCPGSDHGKSFRHYFFPRVVKRSSEKSRGRKLRWPLRSLHHALVVFAVDSVETHWVGRRDAARRGGLKRSGDSAAGSVAAPCPGVVMGRGSGCRRGGRAI